VIILILVSTIIAITVHYITTGLTSNPSLNEAYLEINYSGHYNVTVTENELTRIVSGYGKEELTLGRPKVGEWVISVYVKKLDPSEYTLYVSITTKDGTPLAEDFTSDPFGEIHINLSL
jgi:hypothetical protein